jgi:hypothetical protein
MLMVILMITVSFITCLPGLSILTFLMLSITKSDTSQKRNREWIIEMAFEERVKFFLIRQVSEW